MSTVSESKPWWAMTSAENPLGIDSQPFTTASPRAQIVLSEAVHDGFAPRPDRPQRVLSHVPLPPSGVELGAADRAEVAPATDSQVFGLLEVGDGRDVRRRIHEIGFHRPDREAELLADRLEPLVAPVDARHVRPAEV